MGLGYWHVCQGGGGGGGGGGLYQVALKKSPLDKGRLLVAKIRLHL